MNAVTIGNKVALAIGAGAFATGAVTVAAASLGGPITGEGVGTESAVVAGCQSGALSVAWAEPQFSPAQRTYTLGGLTLSGIQPACQGKPFKLTVSSQANVISEIAGVTVLGNATTVAFSPPANNQEVSLLSITIFNT